MGVCVYCFYPARIKDKGELYLKKREMCCKSLGGVRGYKD